MPMTLGSRLPPATGVSGVCRGARWWFSCSFRARPSPPSLPPVPLTLRAFEALEFWSGALGGRRPGLWNPMDAGVGLETSWQLHLTAPGREAQPRSRDVLVGGGGDPRAHDHWKTSFLPGLRVTFGHRVEGAGKGHSCFLKMVHVSE